MARTLYDKIWESHLVHTREDGTSLLYIDRHLVHEVTSPQAFTGLRQRGIRVAHPERTIATADHSIPTTPRSLPILDQMAAAQQQVATGRRIGAVGDDAHLVTLGLDVEPEAVGQVLLVLDDQMRLQPSLAETFTNPTPTTYVVSLRKGVKFHDGRELTAADVAWTFNSMLDVKLASPRRGGLLPLTSVDAVDRYTARFNLSAPYTSFPINLLLTIVTLGVYVFWARTRTRRYLWSRTQFIDDRLEWTGTGLELFVGYLLAFVLFVLPLGIINLVLQGVMMRGHQGAAGLMVGLLYLAILYLFGVARFRATERAFADLL